MPTSTKFPRSLVLWREEVRGRKEHEYSLVLPMIIYWGHLKCSFQDRLTICLPCFCSSGTRGFVVVWMKTAHIDFNDSWFYQIGNSSKIPLKTLYSFTHQKKAMERGFLSNCLSGNESQCYIWLMLRYSEACIPESISCYFPGHLSLS